MRKIEGFYPKDRTGASDRKEWTLEKLRGGVGQERTAVGKNAREGERQIGELHGTAGKAERPRGKRC